MKESQTYREIRTESYRSPINEMAELHCFREKHEECKMKKVMLLIIALLFSIGANAASLTLSTDPTYSSVNNPGDVSGFPLVQQKWTYTNEPFVAVTLTSTDYTGGINIKWWFTSSDPVTAEVFEQNKSMGTFSSGLAGLSYFSKITAGTPLSLIFRAPDAISTDGNYINLKVSAVPVPAAIWLFAPAMLGFMGIRFNRKNRTVASV